MQRGVWDSKHELSIKLVSSSSIYYSHESAHPSHACTDSWERRRVNDAFRLAMSAHLFFGPRDMVFTELAAGKLLYREAITNGILLSGGRGRSNVAGGRMLKCERKL
jgi:hypothetical protein